VGMRKSFAYFLENPRKNSLVVSWFGMGVARILRMNSYDPIVGWKGEHQKSVGQLSTVIYKYFVDSI